MCVSKIIETRRKGGFFCLSVFAAQPNVTETIIMKQSITELLSRLHQAVNTGDLHAISNCYGDNAKIVAHPLGRQQHDSIAALQAFQQKYMPAHLVTTGDEIVIEAGDIALVISKLYLVPKATPLATPCEGKRALYVMQRQSNGEWRCIIDNFFGTDLLDFA